MAVTMFGITLLLCYPKKGLLLVHLFSPVESKSDVHFRRLSPENSDTKSGKTIFPVYRVFPVPADLNRNDIWILTFFYL